MLCTILSYLLSQNYLWSTPTPTTKIALIYSASMLFWNFWLVIKFIAILEKRLWSCPCWGFQEGKGQRHCIADIGCWKPGSFAAGMYQILSFLLSFNDWLVLHSEYVLQISLVIWQKIPRQKLILDIACIVMPFCYEICLVLDI